MKHSTRAFTRIELAASVAALALLGALAAPILATTRSDAERAGCMNNLRQIGRGVRLWASDHQERVSWRTLTSDGGTLPDTGIKVAAAWFEFSYALSNFVTSPRVLVCPADSQAIVAPSWGSIISTNYRSSVLSYSLGLEVLPESPRSLMAFDYNIRPSSYGAATCSARVNNAGSLLGPDTSVGWTNGIHVNSGDVLLNDGSVVVTDSTSLRKTLAEQSMTDNGAMHFLKAR
jgi:hypothetical protein